MTIQVMRTNLELLEMSLPELNGLVVWSNDFEVMLTESAVALVGRDLCGNDRTNKSWNRLGPRFGMT